MRFPKQLGWLALLAGCRDPRADPNRHEAAPAPSASVADASRQLVSSAEQRRDSTAITPETMSSRDLLVRRSAARALARIADARARELLPLALADDDPEVVTWAAYGLGYACRGREGKTVRVLVARAASLTAEGISPAPLLGPSEALADALGRCAGTEAESTLRAWLRGPQPRAEAAALALGRIATQTGKLDDLTLVALLDAADRAQAPLQNALFPLTRLTALNVSSAERTRALALRLIASHAASLEFAVRVLGRTGAAGWAALGALASQRDLEPGIRAQALRELGSQGASGQAALWTAFDGLLGAGVPDDAALQGETYGPLAALVDALSPPIASSGSKLRALAELAIAESDSLTLARRKIHLRCSAAALLAAGNYQNPRLLACDAAKDSAARELAVLRVLSREKLQGARKRAYLLRAHADDALVREAAIDRIAN